MVQNIIELKHVYKSYSNNKAALKNINLNIQQNELIFLTGHSGAGKSTLFKILSAQEMITSGQATIFGKNLNYYDLKHVHELRKQIGLVFQDYKLVNNLNIFENIALPLRIQNYSNKNIENKLHEVCELLKIDLNLLSELPQSVSGGEQQKIAIARAIISDPQLIIADEPTGSLDKETAYYIFEVLNQIKNQDKTVIIATHEVDHIKNFKARFIELNKGEIVTNEAQYENY